MSWQTAPVTLKSDAMPDPQKPEYGKPWCWTCREHADFRTVTTVHHDEHRTRTTTALVCAACEKGMSTPARMDFAYYGKAGMGCAWAYFSITILAILSLVVAATGTAGDHGLYHALGIVVPVFLIIPTGVLVRASRKYATWKEWAEQRGWEEPPKQERAWRMK